MSAVLLVDLPELGKLFLELGELGLQSRSLKVGSLLIGIDNLGVDELIECLVLVLIYEGFDFGGKGLC